MRGNAVMKIKPQVLSLKFKAGICGLIFRWFLKLSLFFSIKITIWIVCMKSI